MCTSSYEVRVGWWSFQDLLESVVGDPEGSRYAEDLVREFRG